MSFLSRLWSLMWHIFWKGSHIFGNVTGLWNSLWKPAYLFLGFLYKNGVAPLRFLNYGYVPSNDHEKNLLLEVAQSSLETEDPEDKNQIMMYQKLLSLCPLYPDFSGKDLLEIGAGHGGGVLWMKKTYPQLNTIKGIDLTVVDSWNGDIIEGDAQSNPMENESVDLIVNVESSHCYTSQAKYMSEAMRILRPGGYHLWADFRPVGYRMDLVWKQSTKVGFELIDAVDITENVIQSLSEQQVRMRKIFQSRWYTRLLSVLWKNWWAVPGSAMNREFVEGRFAYHAICWKKPSTK